MDENKKILRNSIACLYCGEVIESRHVHDYRRCGCGKVAVDGGRDYLRRLFPAFPTEDHYKELSTFEDTF